MVMLLLNSAIEPVKKRRTANADAFNARANDRLRQDFPTGRTGRGAVSCSPSAHLPRPTRVAAHGGDPRGCRRNLDDGCATLHESSTARFRRGFELDPGPHRPTID